MVSDRVTFRSSAFPVEPGEDGETNPGIYGRSLASWVARQLQGRGVPVEGTIAEDFGRCVLVKRKPFMLWVGCASLDGRKDHWQMFIALERGFIGRFWGGRDAERALAQLREHFRAMLGEIPGGSDVEWEEAVPRGA